MTRGGRYPTVTAKGRFDTGHEVVVRRRTNSDDEIGYHVLTPFVLTDGKVLLVNRGWIPANARTFTLFRFTSIVTFFPLSAHATITCLPFGLVNVTT